MRFLVVGSTFEAAIACEVLGGITGVERVWNLPRGGSGHAIISSHLPVPAAWRGVPTRTVERVVLRNRWGKLLLGHRLDGYQILKLPANGLPKTGPLERLDPSLHLVRCRQGEAGVDCHMSDGTDLACTGVVFADGPRSRGRELMVRASDSASDPRAVACWSFIRPDLLNLKSWEFRTAIGKSVEQLPLPEGLVRVKLRFRTRYGARQSVAELKELFSEFGADMEALFEGVQSEDIAYYEERNPDLAFCPLPGTMALGEAALGSPLLETFDWSLRLAKRQMERLVESVVTEQWNPSAWEPSSREAADVLLDSERYLRGALHYDNVLLRPLRDFALRWVPAGVITDRVRDRLGL